MTSMDGELYDLDLEVKAINLGMIQGLVVPGWAKAQIQTNLLI